MSKPNAITSYYKFAVVETGPGAKAPHFAVVPPHDVDDASPKWSNGSPVGKPGKYAGRPYLTVQSQEKHGSTSPEEVSANIESIVTALFDNRNTAAEPLTLTDIGAALAQQGYVVDSSNSSGKSIRPAAMKA